MSEPELVEALLNDKPYFGPVMAAFQGVPIRHAYMSALMEYFLRSGTKKPVYILEIGSWAGASAVTWANGIKASFGGGQVTCVDIWRPYFDIDIEKDPHYHTMNEAAQSKSIYKLFLHNISAAGVEKYVKKIVGDSKDILPRLKKGSFHIVYIDASHAYENVMFDIEKAKLLIRNNGIICGDDLELQLPSIDPAAHKLALKSKKDYVLNPKTKEYYHPGVTQAVADTFQGVSVWEGFWAVQKVGENWEPINLEGCKFEIPEHIKKYTQSKGAELIEETESYNLIRVDGKMLAVAKSLGPINFFKERIGEREIVPLILVGVTIDEVRERAEEMERESKVPEVDLVEETESYNLIRVDGKTLAVAKSLGPVNLFKERIGERELPPVIFVGDTVDEAREKAIKHINALEEKTRKINDLTRDLEALKSHLYYRVRSVVSKMIKGK